MRILISCLLIPAALCAQSRAKRITPVDSRLARQFETHPNVAVVAGVGHYPTRSGLSELKYPGRDAEMVGAELARQGYKVVSLKEQEATRGSIVRALRDAAELVDRGSGTLLFFFSGHGFTDKGANYLATFESTADDLAASGLPIKTVEALLKASGVLRQVMFIDACRNQPGKSAGARSFERFNTAAGMRALFSTKAGRISFENDELQNGVFTHFLVRGLRGEAAGPDSLITFRDLADFVTNSVSGYGFQRGQMQVPYEAGESSGDFLLARAGNAAPPMPAVEPRPQTVAPAPAAEVSLDQVFKLLDDMATRVPGPHSDRINFGLWISGPVTPARFALLDRLRSAVKTGRYQLIAVSLTEPRYQEMMARLANSSEHSDRDIRRVLQKNKLLDAVFLMGVFPDGRLGEDLGLGMMTSPLGRPVSSAEARDLIQIYCSQMGKDSYVFADPSVWVPTEKADCSPRDAASKNGRISWAGNTGATDIEEFFRSMMTRQPTEGAITARPVSRIP